MSTSTILQSLREARLKADCSRRKVAALVTLHRHVIGVGFNGLQRGSCLGGDCPRGQMTYAQQPRDVGYAESGCGSVHAEVAAIREAGLLASEDCVMYVTERPCGGCAEAITSVGISRVVIVTFEHPVFNHVTFETWREPGTPDALVAPVFRP